MWTSFIQCSDRYEVGFIHRSKQAADTKSVSREPDILCVNGYRCLNWMERALCLIWPDLQCAMALLRILRAVNHERSHQNVCVWMMSYMYVKLNSLKPFKLISFKEFYPCVKRLNVLYPWPDSGKSGIIWLLRRDRSNHVRATYAKPKQTMLRLSRWLPLIKSIR